jgi:hypothetical protein
MAIRANRELAVLALLITGLTAPALMRAADTVAAPGYILLQTQAGTAFAGTPFVGVPIGTFNFGGSIGSQNVGAADTIVSWFPSASAPGPTTVGFTLDDMQLGTASPTSFLGGPVGMYYITLQSVGVVNGPASVGTATIGFAPNTFSSALEVYFNVRFGAVTGPIVYSGSEALSSSGVTWQHSALGGVTPLISGVNTMLDGVDTTEDLHFPGLWTQTGPDGTLVQAEVPEPGPIVLGLLGLAMLRLWRARR